MTEESKPNSQIPPPPPLPPRPPIITKPQQPLATSEEKKTENQEVENSPSVTKLSDDPIEKKTNSVTKDEP